jgi:hypothetical protein
VIEPEFLAQLGGADDPGAVGELQNLSADGAGDGDGGGAWRRPWQCGGEGAPAIAEAGVIAGGQRVWRTQRDGPAGGDMSDAEPGIGAADIRGNQGFATWPRHGLVFAVLGRRLWRFMHVMMIDIGDPRRNSASAISNAASTAPMDQKFFAGAFF